jgi:hypothetical protein
MAWTRDWRIYYIAAALFLIAGGLAWMNDGLGLRPVFGLVMAIGMGLIGHKARREAGGTPG